MTYTKIYNATYSMLNQEQGELLESCRPILEHYGYTHKLRDSVLISIIIHYYKFCAWKQQPVDLQFFRDCVDAYCNRSMTTIDNLPEMLEGRKALKFEINGDNGSNKKGTSPYVRGQEGREERMRAASQVRSSSQGVPVNVAAFFATAEEKYPKPKSLTTIPKDWVDMKAVIEWCERKNIAWEYWDQYFDCRGAIQGRDGVYYELKQEYRDVTNRS